MVGWLINQIMVTFCLGTGVPGHRDSIVLPYVSLQLIAFNISVRHQIIKRWLRALQLSGSREHKSDYGCLRIYLLGP